MKPKPSHKVEKDQLGEPEGHARAARSCRAFVLITKGSYCGCKRAMPSPRSGKTPAWDVTTHPKPLCGSGWTSAKGALGAGCMTKSPPCSWLLQPLAIPSTGQGAHCTATCRCPGWELRDKTDPQHSHTLGSSGQPVRRLTGQWQRAPPGKCTERTLQVNAWPALGLTHRKWSGKNCSYEGY